ncbi:SMC-Scp complex subunit ScpB [Amycolatopsis aidingensis]|uniref:SMC-Scp complex subunit ScpB n=1 Tax=Amycolatopsis aidingensis TaxID=2842453 RepID=UPI001C0CBEC8|nr:SMC-Scp complex subunit ScpB [Amycolatopsis aidingensis]
MSEPEASRAEDQVIDLDVDAPEPEPEEQEIEGAGEGPSDETVSDAAGDEEIGAGDEPVAVSAGGSLPDLSEDSALEAALETLLLVVDSPATEESLADALEQEVGRVAAALGTMATRFTERGSGIDLRRVAEGWRFYTRDTYAPYVEKFLLDGQRSKLTRAALETLAVVAYRQPVTRARVAAVRGVNVDGVIRTLLARGLIEETGTDSETGGTLYVTTELFLERLGLSSLSELPPIAPLLPEVDSIDDL